MANPNEHPDMDDVLNELMKTVDGRSEIDDVNPLELSSDETPIDWDIPDMSEAMKEDDKMFTEALKAIKENVDLGKELLQLATQTAQNSGDSDHIESAASVINSNVATIKALTEVMLKRQDRAMKLKIELLKIASKERIAANRVKEAQSRAKDALPGGNFQQNNYLLQATPDKIFDLLNAPMEKQKEMIKALIDIKEQNG